MVPNAIRSQVASVSSVYDPDMFVKKLNERTSESKFAIDFGSMDSNPQDFEMFSGNPQDMDVSTTNFKSNQTLSDLMDCDLFEDISMAFVSASHAEKSTGVTPEILAKVWRIDNATTKRTIDVTTQLARQDINTSLYHHFVTNGRILRYRRIASFFYTDCFFVTNKQGQRKAMSTRAFTFMKLFVSDKGYVFVVPMHSTSEFPNALLLFAKEVGVPMYLITDPNPSHKPKEVRHFPTRLELRSVYLKS